VTDEERRAARIAMQGHVVTDERVPQAVLRRCLGLLFCPLGVLACHEQPGSAEGVFAARCEGAWLHFESRLRRPFEPRPEISRQALHVVATTFLRLAGWRQDRLAREVQFRGVEPRDGRSSHSGEGSEGEKAADFGVFGLVRTEEPLGFLDAQNARLGEVDLRDGHRRRRVLLGPALLHKPLVGRNDAASRMALRDRAEGQRVNEGRHLRARDRGNVGLAELAGESLEILAHVGAVFLRAAREFEFLEEAGHAVLQGHKLRRFVSSHPVPRQFNGVQIGRNEVRFLPAAHPVLVEFVYLFAVLRDFAGEVLDEAVALVFCLKETCPHLAVNPPARLPRCLASLAVMCRDFHER